MTVVSHVLGVPDTAEGISTYACSAVSADVVGVPICVRVMMSFALLPVVSEPGARR